MTFQYNYIKKEASFGLPIKNQVSGGTHITFEIILKKGKNYIALRRLNGIRNHNCPIGNYLYFCHDLIIYEENIETCVKRIVKEQTNVKVKSFRTVYLESGIRDNKNWAFVPHIIAEVDSIPKVNSEITEVIVFTKSNIPDNFAWWTKKELKEFLDEFD